VGGDGANAFLIGIPSADDLSRIGGMHMGVPNLKAQIANSIWQREDIVPEFVMESAWVHVEGVLYIVRHFHGLWALGSLIDMTLDVDLVSLRSQGVVRPFFWKGDGDDEDNDGVNEDKHDDQPARAPHGTTSS
jgi:hypothetical protein